MSDNKPLGAQISHMLKDRGVDVIFGIPGVHNQEMYRGIEEAGIRHILARHEQGAGFMADGYARASGKPGVAYVITGPGLCNIMTPMGQAFSDSVSMLVLSSCLDETAARRGQLHQYVQRHPNSPRASHCSSSCGNCSATGGEKNLPSRTTRLHVCRHKKSQLWSSVQRFHTVWLLGHILKSIKSFFL